MRGEYVFATQMNIMNDSIAFFEAHIKPAFRKDTNTTIGDVMIALVYPQVIIIGPAPRFVDAAVEVGKKRGWRLNLTNIRHIVFCLSILNSVKASLNLIRFFSWNLMNG